MTERRDEVVPLVDLAPQRARLEPELSDALARVLEHGRFIMGPEVMELEAALGSFAGASEVVSCSSGTDALLLPLLAWGIGPGDVVIVPAFTFAATAEVVALCGATVCFADVDPRTFNLDPASLERCIDHAGAMGHRVRAVIAVDLFGQPADYSAIEPLSADADIALIADAAQSFGGTYGDRRVGSIGKVTATSFFPSKPLGAYGDGGAVLTDDEDLAEVIRSLRVHGQGRTKYDNIRIGTNARLDTLQAAVLLEKLKVFADEIQARQAVAARYNEALGNVVDTPLVAAGSASAWAQYTIKVDGRDAIAQHMAEAGVTTAVYYDRPLHHQPAYSSALRDPAGLDVSETLADKVLSLPMHPYLDPSTQDRVIDALRNAITPS